MVDLALINHQHDQLAIKDDSVSSVLRQVAEQLVHLRLAALKREAYSLTSLLSVTPLSIADS